MNILLGEEDSSDITFLFEIVLEDQRLQKHPFHLSLRLATQ